MNDINPSQIINLKVSRTKDGIVVSQLTIRGKMNKLETAWVARRDGKSSGIHSTRVLALKALGAL